MYICSMDINLFSKITKELLACNGRAVVPGFGVFTTKEMPATFSDRGFTINPPYYRVDFVNSDEDDGAFVELYSRSNNIDRAKSVRMISDFISELKADLTSKKVVTLPEFGKLRATLQNMTFFIQEDNLDIFPSYDYLEPVSLKSLAAFDDDTRVVQSFAVKPLIEDKTVAPPLQDIDPDIVLENDKENDDYFLTLPLSYRTDPRERMQTILLILIILAVFLAAFAVIGRLFPDVVDTVLYNHEQLKILHSTL